MKLSELNKIFTNITYNHDGEFDLLGMITTQFTNEKVMTFLANTKFSDSIFINKNITVIVTTESIYHSLPSLQEYACILCDNPKETFYTIHNYLVDTHFYWKPFDNLIDPSASISQHAILADNSISIGKNTVIEAGVIINSGSIIGDNVIIRSGTIVSSAGFQYFRQEDALTLVKPGGMTLLKDNVEIQQNCCIDKGVLGGKTILNEHVKLDNFIHIAHDVQLGKCTLVTAGVKFGGRVVCGENCYFGLNAIISNGLTLGDNCRISLGSVVTQNVESNKTLTGNFAIEHSKFINHLKSLR